MTIYGFSSSQVIGQHYSLQLPVGEHRDDLAESALREAGLNGSHEVEGWYARHYGSMFWANVVTTALTRGGEVTGFVQIVRDVSDKRDALHAALGSERRFRLLVEGVTDYSIFMLSPEGLITNWGHGAKRIKGYAAEEICRLTFFPLLHP